MTDWVTLMTFTYPHEAYAIRGALNSAGIETFLKDELTIQTDNFLSNAMGGVRLQVTEEQLGNAMEILRQNGYMENTPHQDQFAKKVHQLNPAVHSKESCPFCHSTDIGKASRPGWATVLSILLLRIPLPFLKSNYQCFVCGEEWRFRV